LVAGVDWPAAGDTVSLAGAVDSFPEIAEQPWRESSLARWLKARRNALSTKLAADTLRVVDFCTMVATGWIALLLYSPIQFDAWSHYSLVAVLGGVLLVNLMQMDGVYHPDRVREPLSHLPATGKAILLTAAMLIAVAFIGKVSAEYSRGWALLWLALAFGTAASVRLVLYLVLLRVQRIDRNGWLQRQVAIVGAGPDAERFIAHLERLNGAGIRLLGIYDDRSRELPSAIGDCPVRGTIADLCELCRTVPVDEIFVAMPLTA
jgi:FlaA1/EpsC-like NDP-sugar epimerase